MTYVMCTYYDCIHNRRWDSEEEYGVCCKKIITLDDRVGNIFCGCPDSEWVNKDEEDD